MPRAEAGSAKAIANKSKSKGLTKLQFYCQVCQKACRDDNGFKCHIASETHLRQMITMGESGGGKAINDFSTQFQSEFVALLSRRFSTKRILANQCYQEYIQDKNHLHMNATRWASLTEFCKHLGKTGVVVADETDKGWNIAWIDNSPRALSKQEASMKKDRADIDDEQRQRKLIKEQIERAQREAAQNALSGIVDGTGTGGIGEMKADVGLVREEGGGTVKLSFGFGKPKSVSPPVVEAAGHEPSTSTISASTSTADPASSTATPLSLTSLVSSAPVVKTGFSFGASKPKAFVNPLKGNVFKSKPVAKVASVMSSTPGAGKGNAAEALIREDMERKRRREEGGGGGEKRVRI